MTVLQASTEKNVFHKLQYLFEQKWGGGNNDISYSLPDILGCLFTFQELQSLKLNISF